MEILCCCSIENEKKISSDIAKQYEKIKNKKKNIKNPEKKIEKYLNIIKTHKKEIKRLEEIIKDESLNEETLKIYKEQREKYKLDITKHQKLIEEQRFLLSSKSGDYILEEETEVIKKNDEWTKIPSEEINN